MTGKQKYFRGDVWAQKQIHLRVKESLQRLQEDFARENKLESDEKLLDDVREAARELGHTPNAGEMIGGPYISMRFGSWERVLRLAGLPPAGKLAQLENRQIYKQEYKRQAQLFRQERQAHKTREQQVRREKREAAAQATKEREARDLTWGEAHREDTDEQLLDYVRQCAAGLERSPLAREVEGGTYLARRFGSWSLVLTCAGLPLPKGVEPPKPSTIKAYRQRKKDGMK